MARDLHVHWQGCFDCDKPAPMYMVTEEVWEKACPEYDAVKREIARFWGNMPWDNIPGVELCLSCLKDRLKRVGHVLSIADFPERLPINAGIWWGYREGCADGGSADDD